MAKQKKEKVLFKLVLGFFRRTNEARKKHVMKFNSAEKE
jgi:hypothetical protein